MSPDRKEEIKETVVTWILSQGASTVLLIMQTGLFLYVMYYSVNTAIPKHLQAIQDGYERHATIYAETRREDREAVHQLISAIDNWRYRPAPAN